MTFLQIPNKVYNLIKILLINRSLLLFLTIAFSPFVNATLIKYDFSGVISQASTGLTVSKGDVFTGSWLVETKQDNIPFNLFPSISTGKRYEIKEQFIEIGGTSIHNDHKTFNGLFVTETEVSDFVIDLYPSGFSSEYSLHYGSLGDNGQEAYGMNVNRFYISFSYDGNDIFDDYKIPTDIDFFTDAMDKGIYIQGSSFNGTRTVFLDIYGGIDSITATTVVVVPIPSGLFFSAIALLGFYRSRFN